MLRFICFFVGIAVLALPNPSHAQKSIANVQGGYIGLANLGDVTASMTANLTVQDNDNRRFVGELSLFQIDPIDFPVAGTIAASDKCKIVADSKDKIALLLNWTNFGGGAAVLAGAGKVVINHEDQFTAGLLRPFDDLGVNWGDGFRGSAAFVSAFDGSRSRLPLDLSGLSTGLFQGSIVDADPIDFVGTSSRDGSAVLLAVGDGTILTISGQVRTNERGLPVGIDGSYQVQTDLGKLLDTGLVFLEQDN
ncbi:MAG: hypothetical protein KDB14_12310 [Planctomycetales bacterium]|nr:hypothetical protein [Planctomycetales bacterium]